MAKSTQNKTVYIGFALAILTCIIWAGNFIIARGVHDQIPPITLAFFRWSTASVIIFFLGIKSFLKEKQHIIVNWKYLFWVTLTGIVLFNTFIYIAGHYTPAINLALIGTTSSPVFVILISAFFLREKISPLRIAGLILCISGILMLLSKGSIDTLLGFRFTPGDYFILCSAFVFAIYNILVRRKPATISALTFLFTIFIGGTLILMPFSIIEMQLSAPITWNNDLYGSILYLGIGASVISFLCWNAAIARIGSVRTALFGNLIPIISTLEAVWLLNEKITWVHLVSGVLVIAGLFIANASKAQTPQKQAVPV
jgi:drug/metabolite transporter (DMT)-like permease